VKETDVVTGQLIEASEAAAVVLELADEALDEVTLLVKLLVIPALLFAVRLGRDNGLSSYVSDCKENRVSIVCLVAKDELRSLAFK
jgi:hypothetical protein